MNNHLETRTAKSFLKNFLDSYFIEKDFPLVFSMLDKNFSYQSIFESNKLLDRQEFIDNLSFGNTINIFAYYYKNLKIKSIALSNTQTLLSGDFVLYQTQPTRAMESFKLKFTALVSFDKNWKIVYFDLSTPIAKKVSETYTTDQSVELLEQKLNECNKLLNEKNELFRKISEFVADGYQVCSYNEHFTLKFAGEKFTLLTGYTFEDMKKMYNGAFTSIIHHSDLRKTLAEARKQLEEKNSLSLEYRIVSKDGRTIWVHDKSVLITASDGTIELHSILFDISKLKERESNLLLSEKRYVTAMRLSDITMFEYKIKTGELIFYDNTADMYDMPSIIPNGVEVFSKNVIVPQSVGAYKKMYEKIHKGEPYASCEIKTIDKDKVIRDFELLLTTLYDSDGKPDCAIGVRKNISDTMKLQREKAYSKNLITGRELIYECNINKNSIIYIHQDWENFTDKANFSFTNTNKLLVKQLVAKDFQKTFLSSLSPQHIRKNFALGKSIITFQYQSLNSKGKFNWYEAMINTIKDSVTGDLIIRLYRTDIADMKYREESEVEQSKLSESILANAKIVYKINLSKNLVARGNEYLDVKTNVIPSDNYEHLLQNMAKSAIHQNDSARFLTDLNPKTLLEKFEKNQNQFVYQYRILIDSEEYMWYNCHVYLYRDNASSDIKAIGYVVDFDNVKRAELSLKYNAEHDLMTGLLNRAKIEKNISEILDNSTYKDKHAFLILDIDYFKYVNDNFGHLYGDGIIKEVATELKNQFSDCENIARLGGDEFCIFLSHYKSIELVKKRAQNLCVALNRKHSHNGKSCTISISIGISTFPKCGDTYINLYDMADKALYQAKKEGKNKVCFHKTIN